MKIKLQSHGLILRSPQEADVSKDGRESKPITMVRDAALRAAPRHEDGVT